MNESPIFEIDGEEHCYETKAIGEIMLADNTLFLGGISGPFWENDNDKQAAAIFVNCSDVFMWGCADAEPLACHEIGDFYKAWKKGPDAVTKWACKKRNLQPQAPIREQMKKDGSWDDEMKALTKNSDDKKGE